MITIIIPNISGNMLNDAAFNMEFELISTDDAEIIPAKAMAINPPIISAIPPIMTSIAIIVTPIGLFVFVFKLSTILIML